MLPINIPHNRQTGTIDVVLILSADATSIWQIRQLKINSRSKILIPS